MPIYVIHQLNDRGHHLGTFTKNVFTSREAADKAAQHHYKLQRWSTEECYPVDMECVNEWIANPRK